MGLRAFVEVTQEDSNIFISARIRAQHWIAFYTGVAGQTAHISLFLKIHPHPKAPD